MKNCKFLFIVLGAIATRPTVAGEVIRQQSDDYQEGIVEHHRSYPQRTKHIYYTTHDQDWQPERYRDYDYDRRDHDYYDHDRRLRDSRIFPWNW